MFSVMYSRPPLLMEVRANTQAELAEKIAAMDERIEAIEAIEARRLDMLKSGNASPTPSEEA